MLYDCCWWWTGPNRNPVLNSNVGFFFSDKIWGRTHVWKNSFSSFFGFPPFPCFSSTDSPLTWPAQNSAGSSLLLLICLPIQLLLQVTYLTQKIHFFRQPRTRRTIEQQISVIVNSETNLTFNLLAPAGVLGIIPFEKIFWEKRQSTFRKGLTINEALENFLLWDNVEIFWWLFAINWLKSILIAALWRKFPLLPIKKKRRWSSSGSLHPAGGSN